MDSELLSRVQQLAEKIPVARFTTSPLWAKARWAATTFRWHPASEAPPVLGFVFEDAAAADQLFGELEAAYNHVDRFEELRISIIDGSPPSQPYGYTIHICPDPDSLAIHATGEDLVVDRNRTASLGRWNRMYPSPAEPSRLERFKEEFRRHGEFLLAPVTCREDGKSYFNSKLGFIKHTVEFRSLSDINKDDIDAGALLLPKLVPRRDGNSVQ